MSKALGLQLQCSMGMLAARATMRLLGAGTVD
jgi:hypothetical protein